MPYFSLLGGGDVPYSGGGDVPWITFCPRFLGCLRTSKFPLYPSFSETQKSFVIVVRQLFGLQPRIKIAFADVGIDPGIQLAEFFDGCRREILHHWWLGQAGANLFGQAV